MKSKRVKLRLLASMLAAGLCGVQPALAHLPDSIGLRAETVIWTGTGNFAPNYMAANRFGKLTMESGAVAGLTAGTSGLDRHHRWDYAFGAEVLAGYRSAADYQRYFPTREVWGVNRRHPGSVRLQQLYAEAKWRSVFISAGMKERGSAMLDDRLSSGDLVHSANSRPIPQVRAGFLDFEDIPFTHGELQIEGTAAYGRFTDDDWWRSHFNFYNGHLAENVWYLYRRVYFRTSPRHRFGVTFGAQCVSQFGGSTYYYTRGELVREQHRGVRFGDFFKVFFPTDAGNEDFRIGNTLGSWDFKASYRISGAKMVSAYFQWPWEDGSGMAKRNGWDGLYGIELKLTSPGSIIRGAVIEYLDLTNQSGPMHWAPGDFPGTLVTGEARGADNYYNNSYYNAYANYGQTIGSPMVMGPIYNSDGYMQMIGNRVRGVHAAAEGSFAQRWEWRVMAGWRKAYGNGFEPLIPALTSFSALAEARWRPSGADGLALCIQTALDRGKLPSNSFGVAFSAAYTGKIFGR